MIAAAEDCPGTITQADFDADQFSGTWYALYQPPEMYSAFHHVVIDFGGSPDYEATLNFVSAQDGEEKSYDGTWKPNTPGYFQTDMPELPQFDGPYRVVATDYECYAVMHGCPQEAPVEDLIWIQFRDDQPSEDCVNSAKDAMTAAQLDFSALQLDEE
ncbi:hypothetical protein L9F63_003858 [Diploptera punctata]|uniref:Lipocalin/cytosolic fatty-acid binding domain-containing protein n=1 Tax=Diploptera punctata TaxID=6984 RepID=A0AAD8E9M7_DIPPU|nr:hypothetical protein L9F63_003858 [Diploptera punctata]